MHVWLFFAVSDAILKSLLDFHASVMSHLNGIAKESSSLCIAHSSSYCAPTCMFLMTLVNVMTTEVVVTAIICLTQWAWLGMICRSLKPMMTFDTDHSLTQASWCHLRQRYRFERPQDSTQVWYRSTVYLKAICVAIQSWVSFTTSKPSVETL